MNESEYEICARWEEILATLNTDHLLVDDIEALHPHLATCTVCSALISDYLKMDEIIRNTLVTNEPLGLSNIFLLMTEEPQDNSSQPEGPLFNP